MAKKKKCKSKWNVQKFIEEENEKTISMLNDLSPATDEDVDDAQYNFAKILDLDLNSLGTGYSEEMFGDTTMMAYYDRSNDTIFINPNYLVYKDLIYYSIAHELRHKWQNEHNKEEWFSTYKSRDKLDLEQYNEQIAEMDMAKRLSTKIVNLDIPLHGHFEVHPCRIYLIAVQEYRTEIRIVYGESDIALQSLLAA